MVYSPRTMEKRRIYPLNAKRFSENKKEETNAILFGIHTIEESIISGKEIEKIYFAKNQANLNDLKLKAREQNIPFSIVPIEKIDGFTKKNHQGVVAFVSPIQYAKLDDIIYKCFSDGKNPLILILDRITDVRNLGAISRSAEAAGVDAIVIPSKGAAQITSDAMKTSSGALNFIPVCREENLINSIKHIKDSGLQVVACTEKSDKWMYKVDYTTPTCFIVGSEEDGISADIMKLCDEVVCIPMVGEISSLNVSVASAIVIYEAVRQRGGKK